MIVSTKGRYALRVMVELAQHQGDGYVPLNVIAERQDISEKISGKYIKRYLYRTNSLQDSVDVAAATA
mgnify:CR=1 FL=1